ncbi:MAG: DEAD/DEAH box helicase [Bacteroidia bacterium]|nr:DEAD/DEAH box helicase [Bacteroidia bacterium]
MNFRDFHFNENLQDSLDSMGFENPTPIQSLAIPIIQSGKDIIACAQTGTGKTAAFVLPVIDRLSKTPSDETKALIVAPTRELAMQIDQSIQGLSYFTSTSSIAIYGGGDGVVFEKEKKALTQGANIIIATPGRLLAHLNMGYVKFDTLEFLILDEADRMLDMGFVDDILKIVTFIPQKRQTLMFSATMPEKIRQLAKRLLNSPEEVSIAISKPAEGVEQRAYLAYDKQKNYLIEALLKEADYSSVIIFVGTKIKARELEKELRKMKMKALSIHSDLEQSERENVLMQFRSRQIQILVATDILSRGIDIDDIGLVINYEVPHDAEDYVHRVGRTARAETKGVAITFINEHFQHRFKKIEDLIGYEVKKYPLPEGFDLGPAYEPLAKKSNRSNSRPRHQGAKGNKKPFFSKKAHSNNPKKD